MVDTVEILFGLVAALITLLAGEGTRKVMDLLKHVAVWLDRQNALVQQMIVLVIAFAFNLGIGALSAATGVPLPEVGNDPLAVDEQSVRLYLGTFLIWLAALVRHLTLKKLSAKAVGLPEDPATDSRSAPLADLSGGPSATRTTTRWGLGQ